jgi:uncharacterized RDD family membrane protein YckC
MRNKPETRVQLVDLKPRESGRAGGKVKLKKRFLAGLIDWLIILIPVSAIHFSVAEPIAYFRYIDPMLPSFVMMSPSLLFLYGLIELSLVLGYFTYYFGKGRTIGGKIMGLKICNEQGGRIGYKYGFLRALGYFFSVNSFGLGFLPLLADRNKRNWYDKITKSYVTLVIAKLK